MSYEEQQVEEIKTIRERNITVKLSDADCNRLARKCGEHGLTVGELIENFIGDLIGGTHSNGSDEQAYVEVLEDGLGNSKGYRLYVPENTIVQEIDLSLVK